MSIKHVNDGIYHAVLLPCGLPGRHQFTHFLKRQQALSSHAGFTTGKFRTEPKKKKSSNFDYIYNERFEIFNTAYNNL